ncbi:MAG TPA: hypothetical protein VGG10_01595 [Rhizomicrobium sp.]|jgi:hypothetical protein
MNMADFEPMGSPSFRDQDELLHSPPKVPPDRWQENMFFVAWDLDGGNGVLIHTKRWPSKNDHEAHIVVYVEGKPTSAILHRPLKSSLKLNDEIPELSAGPEVPWSRWRIQAEFDGAPGEGPYGFLAYAPHGNVRGAIDITLEMEIPVADFNQALARVSDDLAASGGAQISAQEHYEQGGRWHGELRVGDRKVRCSGLFVRDHTWGERVETDFDPGVFWTASCLDDGKFFCNAIGVPGKQSTIGGGIVVTPKGAFYTRSVSGAFSPEPGLLTYDRSRIEYGSTEPMVLEGRTKLHVPKYLPGSGSRRYDNNAISYVSIGDKKGMGCLEWAAVLTKEQSDALDKLLMESA